MIFLLIEQSAPFISLAHMRFVIQTPVQGNFKAVMTKFDRQLFEALAPKYGKMEIVAFTGSKKGDHVHIRFIQPFKADWISEIVEDYEDSRQSYFIDIGTKLPFGLEFWRHKHCVKHLDDHHAVISDDITFHAKNKLMTVFLYPFLYLAFYPRKSIYKKYFKKVFPLNPS
jgi:ligand-binding SRPBCC domain-containing protein